MSDRYTRVGNYYVRRPQASMYRYGWRERLADAGEVIGGTIVLTVLFIGLPFVLLMAGQP